MLRPLAAAFALAALAGCMSPGASPEAAGGSTAGKPGAPGTPSATTAAPAAGTPQEVQVAKPAPEPPKAEAPALTGPAARAEAQRLVRHVFELLDQGEEDRAKAEAEQALQLEPENRAAACLLKGITADPQQTLGRDSTPYTVRPGETLARIAQRALGDTCEFYILARYNQIKVPRQLPAGQVIRIPGNRALAGPEPVAPPPAKPAAPVAKPAAPAPAPAEQSAAVNPAPAAPAAPPKPAGPDPQIRAQVERHHRAAFAAFRKQDLATAIREWDRVLEIDPANDLARARRQEALELNRKLREMK